MIYIHVHISMHIFCPFDRFFYYAPLFLKNDSIILHLIFYICFVWYCSDNHLFKDKYQDPEIQYFTQDLLSIPVFIVLTPEPP